VLDFAEWRLGAEHHNINTWQCGLFPLDPCDNFDSENALVDKKSAAVQPRRFALKSSRSYEVCWIAESSQLAPRGRTKVQTSVASIGFSLPLTNRPVPRSRVLSTSENRIATLA
jgi:hypothetical protein